MVEQPHGTVTLVFTDIEGSTLLLRELGREVYREALSEHRRIVREAFAGQGGYEVNCEGDAFFYAFQSAVAALAAVEKAMRGLESGPIRVRVGVHTGRPGLDPPKYVGMDVHEAARIMAAGHGGQVLLSKTTRDLVPVEAKDLGEHRLKDLTDPVWLYQLGDEQFPPLRSLNNTNLPTPATPFLGREPELDEADRLLAGCRLLTVSGPGGAGKTRFAIELASRQLPRFTNGVFWVPLAALRDPTLVVEAIAQTLGARDGLAAHIGARRMLLLVDNLEQVIAAAPQLSELLSACPQLSLLVTSRELLRVRGEVEFALPPLSGGEAVDLFCARGRCRPDATVAELCRRLEGLPLAIELAAVRLPVLTSRQLLDRLGQRLDLLRGGRDAGPRQQTLRATIQWSYDLLTEQEARVFRRLGVFAGGCTLETAEQTCGADLDTLQALVEKSLVRHTEDRFRMLETIREFALEQLEGEAGAARAAYFDWLQGLAERAGCELEGPGQHEWLDRLQEEHANIREVMTLALDAEEGEVALRILVALDRYWWVHPGEAMGWFERGLELRDRVSPALAAHALRVGGTTAWFFGEPRLTSARCREGLAIFEGLGDESGMAKMYSRIAPPLMVDGRLDEAADMLDKAVELHRRLGPEQELAITLQLVGGLNRERGDLARARAMLEEAIELGRRVGDVHATNGALLILADVDAEAGDADRSVGHIHEALQIAWAHRALIDVAMCFAGLARATGAQGDTQNAAMFWGAAERLDEELGPTQFRSGKSQWESELAPAVLADEEALAAGRTLTTAEAVAIALRTESASGVPQGPAPSQCQNSVARARQTSMGARAQGDHLNHSLSSKRRSDSSASPRPTPSRAPRLRAPGSEDPGNR
jgi:predicted ATPase